MAFELHSLLMACIAAPWTHCGRQLQCMRQEAQSARDGPAPSASIAPSAWRATRSSCASTEHLIFITMTHVPDMVSQRTELDLPGIAESLPAAPWDHTPWRAPRALPRFLDVLGPPIIRELVLCKKDFHEPRPRSSGRPDTRHASRTFFKVSMSVSRAWRGLISRVRCCMLRTIVPTDSTERAYVEGCSSRAENRSLMQAISSRCSACNSPRKSAQ